MTDTRKAVAAQIGELILLNCEQAMHISTLTQEVERLRAEAVLPQKDPGPTGFAPISPLPPG